MEGRSGRLKRTALSRARRAMREAQKTGSSEGYGDVARAIRQYLRERWEIRASALTVSGMVEALESLSFPEGTGEMVAGLIERCEVARFDQADRHEGGLPDVIAEAVGVLMSLEGER